MLGLHYRVWRFADRQSAASEWRRLTARLARGNPHRDVSISNAVLLPNGFAGPEVPVLVAFGPDAEHVEPRGGALPYEEKFDDAFLEQLVARRLAAAASRPTREPWHHVQRHGEGDVVLPGGDDVRRCRTCGCTDDDCRGCIERTGEPCSWVDADLCSACALGTAL